MEKLWNFEQLLGLSPDHFTIRSGQGNSKLEKWLTLGISDHFVWGIFNNKSRPPFQVFINLNQMYFCCNCASKKFPCQHILGLHLLWHKSEPLFTEYQVPDWVWAYHTRYLQQWHRSLEKSEQLISKDDLEQLRSGLSELKRWLHDLIQNGLATLTDRKKEYWANIANRMADIQAMALSGQLTSLSALGDSAPDWPEKYLKRISPLALLIASFERFEQQSEDAQADLLTAVGRPFPLLKNGRDAKFDQWLVLGHSAESHGQQQKLATWLWGLNHSQYARLNHIHRGKHPAGNRYLTGTVVSGEIQFLPSAFPLNAQFIEKPIVREASPARIGSTSIIECISHYKQAKTKNPWLRTFPFIFREATAVLENEQWHLIDNDNYSLPIPQKFNYGWHLAALGSQGTLSIFGLWHGTIFEPISAFVDSVWLDLHILRGIK